MNMGHLMFAAVVICIVWIAASEIKHTHQRCGVIVDLYKEQPYEYRSGKYVNTEPLKFKLAYRVDTFDKVLVHTIDANEYYHYYIGKRICFDESDFDLTD